MTAATAPVTGHKVSVTDAGPSRKKLKITIPADEVSGKLKDSLDTLAVEAALPGFRKGKAPRALVEKRFGAMVRGETKSQLVASAYQAAVEEQKLKVVSSPESAELAKQELEHGKDFTFEVEVEVMPDFEMPALDGIKVKKPLIEVPDTAVEEELTKIKINEGSLESRESAEPGDYLTGHGVMVGKDGTNFYDIKGCVVQLPSKEKAPKGMILGVMVEDFSKQFGSPKVGDTATIKTKGPENHEVEAIRGNDLTITFKVDRIDRIIPSSTETVVAMLGMESEAQLKEALKNRLSQRVATQQQVAMRQQVAKHLTDTVKMDLPAKMASYQAARILENRRMELMYRGVDAQKIEEHMAELRTASGTLAQRDLKLFFILHQAAETLGVTVDENEINQRIAQMAYERNVRPDRLRAEIIQSNRVGAVYNQIREHKTMDAILQKASIEEMPVEKYNELMKNQKD
jgi:trigger factor